MWHILNREIHMAKNLFTIAIVRDHLETDPSNFFESGVAGINEFWIFKAKS